MRDFDYSVAGKIDDAFATDGAAAMPIAGGTELLNWLRLGIASPARVVDIGRLEGLGQIVLRGDRLSIGALATLNEIGEHPLVAAHAAVLGDVPPTPIARMRHRNDQPSRASFGVLLWLRRNPGG